MVYALMTLSDKPHMGSVTSGPNAADTVAMSEILFGGREAIEAKPASLSLINVNSPLRFDDRIARPLSQRYRPAQRRSRNTSAATGRRRRTRRWRWRMPAQVECCSSSQCECAGRHAEDEDGFVANASHELRTPLTAIKIAFETLAVEVQQDDPEQTARYSRHHRGTSPAA